VGIRPVDVPVRVAGSNEYPMVFGSCLPSGHDHVASRVNSHRPLTSRASAVHPVVDATRAQPGPQGVMIQVADEFGYGFGAPLTIR
jgi:hypothetical protein